MRTTGKQLHWGAARIQPVHRPGGVVPAPPHRGKDHDGLGSTLPGEVLDEQVRELDDGEDVDQVEEELDGADLGSTVPGAGERDSSHSWRPRVCRAIGSKATAPSGRPSGWTPARDAGADSQPSRIVIFASLSPSTSKTNFELAVGVVRAPVADDLDRVAGGALLPRRRGCRGSR